MIVRLRFGGLSAKLHSRPKVLQAKHGGWWSTLHAVFLLRQKSHDRLLRGRGTAYSYAGLVSSGEEPRPDWKKPAAIIRPAPSDMCGTVLLASQANSTRWYTFKEVAMIRVAPRVGGVEKWNLERNTAIQVNMPRPSKPLQYGLASVSTRLGAKTNFQHEAIFFYNANKGAATLVCRQRLSDRRLVAVVETFNVMLKCSGCPPPPPLSSYACSFRQSWTNTYRGYAKFGRAVS